MDYKRVLRLHYENGYNSRAIGKQTFDGKSTVAEFLKRFEACPKLSWPLSEEVTNEYIEDLLYKKKGNTSQDDLYRSFDEEEVHRKLAKKGETLLHLWRLYNAEGEVDGKKPLSYRQYCRRYAAWMGNKDVVFHIQRYPGVNLELDFAGKTLNLHDQSNPDLLTKVTIFVATLSFSDFFYIEGMTKCDIANWIRVNNNALDYFGGVTQTVTPDNCKVAVITNKDWIDPALNTDFQAWAEHNGTVILPAKVRSPRWKPNVEGHVKIVTMHILVDMDDMVFYSLEELNKELWRRMEEENRVNFSKLSYSRRDLFEKEEKEALLPLPDTKYEYLVRKTVTVSQDFSFIYDQVHYTMPRKYLKKQLEVRAGATKLYVYNEKGDLIRTHERSYTPKSWVVIPSDMPKEYSDYGYWNAPYFLNRAAAIGPQTREAIQRVIAKFDYPVQSFRSCFGILRFAERYSKMALEECCADAVRVGKCSYNYISNTISMYAHPGETRKDEASTVDRMKSTLKPMEKDAVVTGAYKDNDDDYSLENLLRKQKESDFQ